MVGSTGDEFGDGLRDHVVVVARRARIERRPRTASTDGSSPHRRHMNKMLITIWGFVRMVQG
jgi:hypothetical protein